MNESSSENMQGVWPPSPVGQPVIAPQTNKWRNPAVLGAIALTTIVMALLFVGAVHSIAYQPNAVEHDPLVYRIQYEPYKFGAVLSSGYFIGAIGFILSGLARRERLGRIGLVVGLFWFLLEVGIRLGLPWLFPIPPQIQ